MAPTELSLQNASARTNRSHSISSDRPSLTGYGGLLSPPLSITPESSFIAASAASQIITNDHDSQADAWLDQHGIEPSGETAMVAPLALKLVNRFLDQLLFNFLSISRSTSLASLRPAVNEVLKPKLAKEAINGADQELHEYLGDGEDEELFAFHDGREPSADWDLELVWKCTRLRCMVYSSLGDMEEEDEDFYADQEQLDGPPGSNTRFPNNQGVVSPAVAIFLTSILEYMGEQVLVIAGQAAYHRLRAKHEREDREGISTHAEIAKRVVVEEADMERVALDRTLGRLWRGWKKRIRSPNHSVSLSHSFSRESMRSQPQASRAASIAPEDYHDEDLQRPSIDATLATHEYAARIPLPVSEDDIREIEIPGLSKPIDGEEDEQASTEEVIYQKERPKSLVIPTSRIADDLQTPTSSQARTPLFLAVGRKRSHSVPLPAQSIFTSPSLKRLRSDTDRSNGDQVMEEDPVTHEMSDEVTATSAEGHKVEDHDMMDKPIREEASDEQVTPETEEHQFQYPNQEQKQFHESKDLITGVVAGATTIAANAVTAIAAAVTGQAPQTEADHERKIDAEEDLNEEPQILTSSRVSLGGCVTPENAKPPSRQGSVRANSVHSLRVIDVASPRSPARSRHGSVDAADFVGGRPPLVSRSNSIHSTMDGPIPRMASPISRGPTSSPLAGSPLSGRHVRNSAGEPISEEKEAVETDSPPLAELPTDLRAATVGDDVVETSLSRQSVSQNTTTDPAAQHPAAGLSAPSRNAQDITNAVVDEPPATQSTSNSNIISTASGLGLAEPPLTALRDMREQAPNISDEASSSAPSQDGHSLPEHGLNGHSSAVSGPILTYGPRDSSRSIRPQSASVPYNSSPRSSRDDRTRKEQPKRAVNTSGSGSGSSSASHKLKPVRTSEEIATHTAEKKSQSFEQLIRSDQTIQYTLTPETMRNIEVSHPQSIIVT